MPHSFVPGCTLRYFFNLNHGKILIRDEQGIEAASIQSAMVSAMEMIEELRAEDPAAAEEWQGWRLEIVDALGRLMHSIPLSVRPIQ